MKKFLTIFCSVSFIVTVMLFAYNSDKGPARQADGIMELPRHNDSLVKRGRQLVEQLNYSGQDIEAIATYLESR